MKTWVIHSVIFGMIFSAQCSFAQYFGTQRRAQFFYCTTLDYPSDTNFRVVAMGVIPGVAAQSRIFVYGKNLALRDSINLLKGVVLQRNKPLKVGSSLLWAGTFSDTLSLGGNSSLVILELDTFYKFKDIHFISTSSNLIYQAVNICRIGNQYYVGVMENLAQSTIYKLNMQFQKLDSVSLISPNVSIGLNELLLKGDKLLLTVNGNSVEPCAGKLNSTMKSVLLDSSLALTDCVSYDSVGKIQTPGLAFQTLRVLGMPFISSKVYPISSTKDLVLGVAYISYLVGSSFSVVSRTSLINAITDNSGMTLGLAVTGNSAQDCLFFDYSNYADARGSMVVSVGSKGYDTQYPYIAQPQKTEIIVTRMDTSGLHLWSKSYGNDMYYYPNSITLTSDSGMLVAGWRYDYKTMKDSTVWESFLLRLDKNGNVQVSNPIGIKENKNRKSLLLFPNPADDYIDFSFDKPFEYIEILDLQGRSLMKASQRAMTGKLEVSELSSGSYLLRARTMDGYDAYQTFQKD